MDNALNSFDIVIVGGGFSGVAAAVEIMCEARTRGQKLSCAVFEPRKLLGAGIAYSTRNPVHLLNVPASKMGIGAQDPAAFSKWLKLKQLPFDGDSFVPRQIYSDYLESELQKTRRETENLVRFTFERGRVDTIALNDDESFHLKIADGRRIKSYAVVLAMGNIAFQSGLGSQESSVLQLPWDEDAISQASLQSEIGILGSGLTAIDTVLALENQKCRARYTIVSRHGRLPEAHLNASREESSALRLKAESIFSTTSVRIAMRRFRGALNEGFDWRELIDELRANSQMFWSGLDRKNRMRFLRHIRPYWETHRHRAPAESIKFLERLSQESRLRIIAGNCLSVVDRANRVEFTVRPRYKTASVRLMFDVAFNCSGLCPDIRRSGSQLLRNLIASGQATYDDLFLGLRADSIGRLINADGESQKRIFTLGSLRRGELWETTAVREIREQARSIAAAVVSVVAHKGAKESSSEILRPPAPAL